MQVTIGHWSLSDLQWPGIVIFLSPSLLPLKDHQWSDLGRGEIPYQLKSLMRDRKKRKKRETERMGERDRE